MDHPPQVIAPAPRAWARAAMLVPALALFALIGGLFPSFSPLANLYVLLLGGAVIWLGRSGRLPRRRSPRRLPATAAWWAVPALCLALVELVDFSLGSTYPHPTLSLLMDPLLDHYLARALAYFGWLAAFLGLARR